MLLDWCGVCVFAGLKLKPNQAGPATTKALTELLIIDLECPAGVLGSVVYKRNISCT